MSDESVGYYWRQAALEREAREEHDRVHHKDPSYYWSECSICAERVNAEIDEGLRDEQGEPIHAA